MDLRNTQIMSQLRMAVLRCGHAFLFLTSVLLLAFFVVILVKTFRAIAGSGPRAFQDSIEAVLPLKFQDHNEDDMNLQKKKLSTDLWFIVGASTLMVRFVTGLNDVLTVTRLLTASFKADWCCFDADTRDLVP